MQYYNPELFTPKKTLERVHLANPTDRWTAAYLKIRKVYPSREAVLAENINANVFFYENGKLYEAELIPEWYYKPCTSVEIDGGINWNTYYSPDLDTLKNYLADRGADVTELKSVALYDAKYGLYEVQMHYSGRLR